MNEKDKILIGKILVPEWSPENHTELGAIDRIAAGISENPKTANTFQPESSTEYKGYRDKP